MKHSVLIFVWLIMQLTVSAQDPVYYIGETNKVPLRFDGYTTGQEIAMPHFPDRESFSVECWMAPQEYSFNVSAIINRQQNFQRGFLLGINHVGQLVGALSAGGQWHTCTSEAALPLLRWSHIAFTYTAGKGVCLYIDGEPAGELQFPGQPDLYPEGTLTLGKTQEKMAPAYTERKTSQMEKTWMYYNGLIRDLAVTSQVLTAKELRKQVKAAGIKGVKALEFPQMPGADILQGDFGAFYTRLNYTPGWESAWKVGEQPDVVVRFPDTPIKYIFWRGTGYIPAVVTENNIWMADQSVENFATGECYETMGDKQCRYSHVRILESTPARCVIHWRYALASISHHILHENDKGWGDWVDEYWTIYPDGIAARKQILYSEVFVKNPSGYQFQETIFFNQPGTKPQDNIEMEAIHFCDMEGNVVSYNWQTGPPAKFDKGRYQPIQLVNLKSVYKPFSIFHPERYTKPFSFGWVDGYSTFPCWNHWPVSQIKSDGRNAPAFDRPSHSSLAETVGKMQIVEFGPDNTALARQLIGMTNCPVEELLPLARSWNAPAELQITSGDFLSLGYDVYQRVYRLEREPDGNEPLAFSLKGSTQSPILNIALEITGWNSPTATLFLNGKEQVNGKDYVTGYLPGLEQGRMILWIYCKAEQTIKVKVVP